MMVEYYLSFGCKSLFASSAVHIHGLLKFQLQPSHFIFYVSLQFKVITYILNSSHWHSMAKIKSRLTELFGTDSEEELETVEKSIFWSERSMDPCGSFSGKSESLEKEFRLDKGCPRIADSMSNDRFAGELLCLSRSRIGVFEG